MGILEKLTNVVEITLAATLLVPQPHRFPDTLQAEDKLCEEELPAPPSTCWWMGGVEALTPQPPFTDPAGHVMNSLGRTRESRRSGTSTLFFKSVIPDQNIESVQHVDIQEPSVDLVNRDDSSLDVL
jgi:hypothetical protein